jgi:3-oxoacyl-[acyl-carrier-protein] synthase-3
MYSRITGTGSCLPPRRLTNADLVARTGRTRASSRATTGSSNAPASGRHFVDVNTAEQRSGPGGGAAGAGAQLATWMPAEIDLIIVGTSTPDMVFPVYRLHPAGQAGCCGAARHLTCRLFARVHLCAHGGRRDDQGGYAAHKALVIGAEVFSRILDFKDRTTCVLFGDGAGAVVLEASEPPASWPPTCMPTANTDILCVPGHVSGGAGVLGDAAAEAWMARRYSNWPSVCWTSPARAVLAKAGKTEADMDWLIPHQANIRIMQSTAQAPQAAHGQGGDTVDQHGNTSAASIPLALDSAVRSGKVKPGQTLLLEGRGRWLYLGLQCCLSSVALKPTIGICARGQFILRDQV